MAAVLASGPGAVLSHRSAAALWGLTKPGALIDVSALADRRDRAGVKAHRPTQLPYTDLTTRHRIPVTRPPRTLIDLAEVTSRRPLERALDETQRLGLCTEAALRASIAQQPGRIGAARMGRLLDDHAVGSTATENDFEELFLAVCDAHGFPRPRCQEWVMGYRVDFLWQKQRAIVETDGRGSHTTDRAFESDRARDNELGSADWDVRRFTGRQLTSEPDWVAAKVAEALARLTKTSIEKS